MVGCTPLGMKLFERDWDFMSGTKLFRKKNYVLLSSLVLFSQVVSHWETLLVFKRRLYFQLYVDTILKCDPHKLGVLIILFHIN